MLHVIKNNLTIKVLLVLAAILATSFVSLCLVILLRQETLLSGMGTKINSQLEQSSQAAEEEFATLGNDVARSLEEMGQTVTTELLATTEKALNAEEQNVSSGMEEQLVATAEGIASLMASVAIDDIMAKKFGKLFGLSRAGAESQGIVFILFLDEEGQPLPSFLNPVDPTISGYLADFQKDPSSELEIIAQQALEVAAKARRDDGLLVHSSPISYYGKEVGRIVIGVSKAEVQEEMAAMARRFDDLKENTRQSIRSALTQEADQVVSHIGSSLAEVQQSNSASLQKTAGMLQQSSAEVKSSTARVVTFVGLLSCLLILVLFALLQRAMVIAPLKRVADGLRDAAEGEGDLRKRLGSRRGDEIGTLAAWFDAFVGRLETIIVDIRGNSETVSASSVEVLSASESLKKESSELSFKADSVAAASEEMSSSMSSVAAASEQASTNISLVAETATEMKEAMESAFQQCREATETSHSAGEQVRTATDKVSDLGEAAREISKVTEVITEIADQTNLLALNATIEAARAGEAGKGFAVVAGEIKGLATQTQEATREIKQKIEGIQASTAGTIEAVEKITGVIGEVDAIIGSISQAMQAQSEKASEVARNIDQASQGMAEVNENVAQSSHVSTEISQDIGEVSTIGQEMNRNCDKLRSSAEALSELSSQLRTMISVFKVSRTTESRPEGAAKA